MLWTKERTENRERSHSTTAKYIDMACLLKDYDYLVKIYGT